MDLDRILYSIVIYISKFNVVIEIKIYKWFRGIIEIIGKFLLRFTYRA